MELCGRPSSRHQHGVEAPGDHLTGRDTKKELGEPTELLQHTPHHWCVHWGHGRAAGINKSCGVAVL
eukprot:2947025-Prorocentrum_lima.AAC.1